MPKLPSFFPSKPILHTFKLLVLIDGLSVYQKNKGDFKESGENMGAVAAYIDLFWRIFSPFLMDDNSYSVVQYHHKFSKHRSRNLTK